jgi:hypothetical protein
MAYQTLGELRARLRARLGYSSAGAAAGVNQEIINSFLQDAQVALYWTHDWARLRAYSDISIGVNQYLVDYPTAANPERVKAISILLNGIWTPPLKKGITPEHYTTQANVSVPYRWEPYAQIEFWPKADQIYTGRVFYVKNLDPFTEDGHRATIDHDLIFQLALADAKGHYRHPDAPNFKARAENLLISLKAKNWGQSVFSPDDYDEDPIPKPVVV